MSTKVTVLAIDYFVVILGFTMSLTPTEIYEVTRNPSLRSTKPKNSTQVVRFSTKVSATSGFSQKTIIEKDGKQSANVIAKNMVFAVECF